jgi:hypothetical protein
VVGAPANSFQHAQCSNKRAPRHPPGDVVAVLPSQV